MSLRAKKTTRSDQQKQEAIADVTKRSNQAP
jgi:hypothetical protein